MQTLVLLLEVRDAGDQVEARGTALIRLDLFETCFSQQCAAAEPRQFIRHVANERIQLVERIRFD